MIESYPIAAEEQEYEEEIKHSRFISLVFPCHSPEEFKQQLQQIKQRYPGASHYCQAFICGAPMGQLAMGSSDDGEPGGSAGRPMLAVLQGAGIGEISAVVVRYYGGTKLGVGGLVRAYSSGLKQMLPRLATKTKMLREKGYLVCRYDQLADVEHLLQRLDVLIEGREFSELIRLTLAVPLSVTGSINKELAPMSQGQLKIDFSQ